MESGELGIAHARRLARVSPNLPPTRAFSSATSVVAPERAVATDFDKQARYPDAWLGTFRKKAKMMFSVAQTGYLEHWSQNPPEL